MTTCESCGCILLEPSGSLQPNAFTAELSPAMSQFFSCDLTRPTWHDVALAFANGIRAAANATRELTPAELDMAGRAYVRTIGGDAG